MFDKKQEQNQSQNIDIAYEKHGIISELHCPYYNDEMTDFFRQQRFRDEGTEANKNKELYFKSQTIKAIVFEGKVRKVICHHFDNSKKCNSPLRQSEENKICHISD